MDNTTNAPAGNKATAENQGAEAQDQNIKKDPSLVKIEELSQKLKEQEEKYLRLYADFENYKRRQLKDRDEWIQGTRENILKDVLEVKDHLELALSHAPEVAGETNTIAKALREGVSLTLKQFSKLFDRLEVKELETKGAVFNPVYHEAIQQMAVPGQESGKIVQVYQKGYTIQGRLLRPARVSVAQ